MAFSSTGLNAKNVALVIGNQEYSSVSSLANPTNDSVAVSDALTQQGFDVTRADNLTREEFLFALRAFRKQADGADIALLYYAGHGIEIGGVNYLLPVDTHLEDERDARVELINVDTLIHQMSGAKKLKMVVLDACRNNPFLVTMRRVGLSRSVDRGLVRARTSKADTLIAFAAAVGEITPDGAMGGNSPFTSAFLKALEGPPVDVRRLLGAVQDEMRKSVPSATPFVYNSLVAGNMSSIQRMLSQSITQKSWPKKN